MSVDTTGHPPSTWYQVVLREQYARHDFSGCVDGAACTTRDRHVRDVYMPQALARRAGA